MLLNLRRLLVLFHINSSKMITETVEIDYTLVQLLIKTIKDGNIDQIRNYIDKYGLDVTIIKDTQLDQNCLFFCCLIKDDEV